MNAPFVQNEVAVLSYEMALAQGIRAWKIRHCAKWHKVSANNTEGRNKERHFRMAAELNRLAAKLEEGGRA